MLKTRCIVPALLSLLLHSCETARYFAVETQQPAAVTFPTAAPVVVVVDNAAVQPPDIGFQCSAPDRSPVDKRLQKDSVTRAFPGLFASSLDESRYFQDVLIYNLPLRDDRNFLTAPKVSPAKVREIAGEVAADALLTVDRLLFNVSQYTEYMYDNVVSTAILRGQVSISAYVPGRETALASIEITDTVRISRYVEDDSLALFKYLPEHFLENAARVMAEKATRYFAPYWTTSGRVLYTGIDSRMKSAFVCAQKDRWEEASDIWRNLYGNEKSNKRRGMIAVNIAVSEEMRDRYADALEWLAKALAHYATENPHKVADETAAAKRYQKELEERINQNILLNRQLR